MTNSILIAVVATSILGLLLWRLVLRPVYALTAHAKAGQITAPKPNILARQSFVN
jgi:hypothetical protein